jgi:hypothetical protein
MIAALSNFRPLSKKHVLTLNVGQGIEFKLSALVKFITPK